MRYVQTTDHRLILRLDKKCFPLDEPTELEDITWWVVYDKKTPVAYCGVQIIDNTIAYLCRSGVVPKYRGRGLQRKLIRIREGYAISLGIKEVVSYTLVENFISSNNLIAEGYKLYQPEDPDEWAGPEALYWQKYLLRSARPPANS